ncbi:MAG: hypothetical protein IPK07_23290 [Deltaproteobacteria bacterium]|nr:hypothetical protein [Deltaproteobacteria bacterium]
MIDRAARFVEEHGIVLASARGPAPRLIDHIAGEAITGHWWSHPRAKAIYNVLAQVQGRDDVLVCRLIRGKVTLVHRRLWPALVRLAARFPAAALARVSDEHTPAGRHVSRTVAFPDWVPPGVLAEGRALTEAAALAGLPTWLEMGGRRKA